MVARRPVTSRSAISKDAGAIAPGKRADVVLLNANPLTDVRNVHDISAVILRGRALNRAALDHTLADAVRFAATQ
jgi:imidazolonepropionase-like amidohydrolase